MDFGCDINNVESLAFYHQSSKIGVFVHKTPSLFVDPVSKITYCTNDIPHSNGGLNTSLFGVSTFSVSQMRFLIQDGNFISGKQNFENFFLDTKELIELL
jgi:hypothetical protein